MLKKLASALSAALLIAAPAMAQYVNYPIAPINTPITTPQDAANSALSKVNAYLQANPSGLPTNNPTFTGTLTGPNYVVSSSQLFAGPLTSETYGSPAINVQSLFWGLNAGATFPTSGADLFPSIGIGAYALANFSALGAETTCVGALSCQFLTTGTLNTAFGMHALGSEISGNSNVAIGNDAMRDAISSGGSIIALGASASAHGNSGRGVFVGQSAGAGSSSSIILSGTVTAGNTITLNMSNGGSTSVTNLPYSNTYTVQGGDTLSSIATAVCNSFNSAAIKGPSYSAGCSAPNLSPAGAIIEFAWPGTQSVGWKLTPTVSTAQGTGGSNTLTATLNGGTQWSTSILIGPFAGTFPTTTNPQNIVCIGDSACEYAGGNNITAVGTNAGNLNTTGGSLTYIGALAGQNSTTQNDNVAVGFFAGYGLTTGTGNNTIVGARSGFASTTMSNTTVIGHSIDISTVFTGSGGVYIGSGAKTVEPISTSSVGEVNIENVYRNYSSSPTITTGQALGTTPAITANGSHVFKAVVGASPTGTTETLTFGTAANGWMCVANDVTTSANTAKITASSATSVTMTWSGTLTASDVILHMCDAY